MYPSRPRTDGDVISSAPRVALRSTLGLSHYAPLGRTILQIRVDCTMQAIQVVMGYSGWRLPMVLCPNGAQGDSPGQSEAPPWDSVRNNFR